jgi:hypothetical protein
VATRHVAESWGWKMFTVMKDVSVTIKCLSPEDPVFRASVVEKARTASIDEVLRLRAIKPSVCDRSAKRFAQDDGFVGDLEIQQVGYANTKRSKDSQTLRTTILSEV